MPSSSPLVFIYLHPPRSNCSCLRHFKTRILVAGLTEACEQVLLCEFVDASVNKVYNYIMRPLIAMWLRRRSSKRRKNESLVAELLICYNIVFKIHRYRHISSPIINKNLRNFPFVIFIRLILV